MQKMAVEGWGDDDDGKDGSRDDDSYSDEGDCYGLSSKLCPPPKFTQGELVSNQVVSAEPS